MMGTGEWIDVFNGDADGLCALRQLRLREPRPEARLVTGVKRDIALLERVEDVSRCTITVLDLSLDRNRSALERLLALGNRVMYIDHHHCDAPPVAELLATHIDPSPQICTSLIVDGLLAGVHRPWAVAGAFGDNLDEVAQRLAASIGLDSPECDILREVGRLLNYNGYGLTEADLLIHPAELYREMARYADPFDFFRASALLAGLRQGYESDMARAAVLPPHATSAGGRIYLLPRTGWANRVVGPWANQLSREQSELAHAILLPRPDGGFLVSVRAPLATRQGADALCRQFPTGGGRAAAAGIDRLADKDLARFQATFFRHFSRSITPLAP